MILTATKISAIFFTVICVNATTQNATPYNEYCSETRCHQANFANLGKSIYRPSWFTEGMFSVYDACWTMDIMDSKNCVHGYEARAIENVDASTLYGSNNKNLTYFTCCKPEYEGEVERQCNSQKCHDDFIKCGALPEGDSITTIEGNSVLCNDDDDKFKHPNIVWSDGKGQIVYNCCKMDDYSIRNFTTECSMSICGNDAGDCGVSDAFGILPDAISCNDDRYKYHNLYLKMDINGRFFYTCCQVDDGSLSDLSPGGYFRNNIFYLNIIPQLILSSTTVLVLAVLMSSILGRKKTRSEVYNIYIIFLSIPDFILNITLVAVLSMLLLDKHIKFASRMLMFHIPCITVNIWINTIVAHEILTMVLRSRQCMRSKPPSLRKVLFQCIPVYLFAAGFCVLTIIYYVNEFGRIFGNWILLWVWVVSSIILPCGYLIYAFYRIWKTGTLSLTGRTRTLTIYFTRIIVVFVVFTVPYGILQIIQGVSPEHNKPIWVFAVLQYLSTLQGLTSAIFSFMKSDISQSFRFRNRSFLMIRSGESASSLFSSMKKLKNIGSYFKNLRSSECITSLFGRNYDKEHNDSTQENIGQFSTGQLDADTMERTESKRSNQERESSK